jgi:hypothetical protein
MHSNEFERQVQQKTEGLKVTPSDGLWDKIEAQLPAQQRRRLAAWWWLPLLLVAGGAGWWWAMQEEKPTARQSTAAVASTQTSPHINTNKVTTVSPESGAADITAGQVRHDSSAQQPIADNGPDVAIAAPPTTVGGQTRLLRSVRQGNNVYIAPVFANPTYSVNKAATSAATGRDGGEPDFQDMGQPAHAMASKEPAGDWLTSSTWKPTALPFGGRTPLDAAMRKGQRVTVALPPIGWKKEKKMTPPKKKSGWDWGFTLGAGPNWREDKLFGDSSLFSRRAFDNSSVIGSGGGFNNSRRSPVQPRPGLSLSAGLQASRELGKRWSVQVGLEYTYGNYRQPVNAMLPDTGVVLTSGVTSNLIRNSYRTGDSAVFTNRFHFVNLPITLQYHLGRGGRWRLQTGLVLGYTMATNALIYNPVNVGYFKSRESVNRFNLSWLGGVGYQLKPHAPAVAGVRIGYNISSLINKSIELQRMLSAQAYVQFPLKKK